MKKLFLVLIVFGITGASLFAWEPQDLTKFPSGQDGKSWLLNFGIGIPLVVKAGSQDDFVSVPPIHLTLDKNVELGDKKLPFFIGGIFGYSGYGYTKRIYNFEKRDYEKQTYFFHNISLGGRFGYHFNWGVNNLDTYAVATAGWIFYSGDYDLPGMLLAGANVGARYFVSKWFGFWIEAGYTSFSLLDIGLAFKF